MPRMIELQASRPGLDQYRNLLAVFGAVKEHLGGSDLLVEAACWERRSCVSKDDSSITVLAANS